MESIINNSIINQNQTPLNIIENEISNNIEVEEFYSFDELTAAQSEWDEYIEAIEGEIFLTYDWCRIWWKYYGNNRKLKVYVFRRNGNICGIIPIFIERIWLGPVYLKVVNIVGSDYQPVAQTLPIRDDCLCEVMRIFLDKINVQYAWDVLHLGPICGRYPFYGNLVDILKKLSNAKYQIREKSIDDHTYFQVAKSWEEQLANLSYKQRSNMKRKYERVIKQGISIQSIPATSENIDEYFNSFVEMHQSHWQKLGKPGHFKAWPKSYEFHKEMSRIQLMRNRLRLYSVKVQNQCIGYSYAYKYGKTYFRYLYSRNDSNDYDYAKIDYAEMVKRAISENVTCLDSMKGKYDFKLQLGGMLLPINNIFICKNNKITEARIVIFRQLARGLDIMYYKIWRSRLALLLKIKLGSFSRIWLRTNLYTK